MTEVTKVSPKHRVKVLQMFQCSLEVCVLYVAVAGGHG